MSKKLENQWIRIFEVIEPRKHKNGFTVYKVISRLFPKNNPQGLTTLKVWKRFNDFKTLYLELQKIHKQLYLPGKFPTFPIKSKIFGIGRFDFDVVEERRKAGLELLEFSARYTQLFTSKIFNQFFEHGYDESDLLGTIPKDQDLIGNKVSESTEPKSVSQQKLSTECLVPERLWTPPLVQNQSESESIDEIDIGHHSGTDTDSMLSGCIFSGADNGEVLTIVPDTALQVPASIPITDTLNERKDQIDQGINVPITSEEDPPLPCNAESISTNSYKTSNDKLDQNSTLPFSSQNQKSNKKARGLFDFLSSFRTNETKASSNNQFFNSTNGEETYICEAAGYFAVAQSLESDGDLSGAFASYKDGIRTLLTGVKSENDAKRKIFVRRKLETYLSRAETLNQQISGVSLENQTNRSKFQENGSLKKNDKYYLEPSPLHELKNYKVCRLLDENVYVVFNVADIPKGLTCYIMKVLSLSSSPIQNHEIIIPQQIPFMARIIKWFKTQYSYVLLLEYASGGRLIDFVKRFQSKMNSIDMNPEDMGKENGRDIVETTKTDREIVLSALEELEVQDEPCASYSKLFEEYSNLNPEVMDFKMVQHVDSNSVTEQNGSNGSSSDEVYLINTKTPILCMNNNHIDLKKCQRRDIDTLNATEVGADELIEISKLLLHDLDNTLQDKIVPNKKSDLNIGTLKIDQENRNTLTLGSAKSMPKISLSLSLENLAISSHLISSSFGASVNSSKGLPSSSPQILQMLPECCLKVWAAEMVLCLGTLHETGLSYGNLQMNSILLGENGHILLAFRGLWPEVDDDILSMRNPYLAPELFQFIGECSVRKLHQSCDYWSLGAILFELIVGQTVHIYHPEGFYQNTVIRIPDTNVLGEHISNSAKTLLTELLQGNPANRLGYFGAEEIKSHPFFECFDWDGALEAEMSKLGHGMGKP